MKKMNYDEKLMYDLYTKGLSDRKIASEVGCVASTIFKWRVKNGLVANHIRIDVLFEYTPTESDKPWKDPESLFCDREFLESFIGKGIKACKCSD